MTDRNVDPVNVILTRALALEGTPFGVTVFPDDQMPAGAYVEARRDVFVVSRDDYALLLASAKIRKG